MQNEQAVATDSGPEIGVDVLLEPLMAEALTALDGHAPLLAGMVRYHLGYADLDLRPVNPRSIDRGKRIRPAITLLVAGTAGGDPVQAAPVAAAIELLHNFTLIHDDIQDESATRRHRPTIWHVWGAKQAINAGDALFAVAHLPLHTLPRQGVPAERALTILDAFERMTIEIVSGQTLDLSFETREDVTADDYLEMISGKTSAIIRFAAWAGATIAGADAATAARWADFGLELGLGFQIHDDLLGVWGTQAETGKRQADDIRRRKKSYPFLLLRERLDPPSQAELNAIYARTEVSEEDVTRVLSLMDTHGVRRDVERVVANYHDSAAGVLADAARSRAYQRQLQNLVESLATRTF